MRNSMSFRVAVEVSLLFVTGFTVLSLAQEMSPGLYWFEGYCRPLENAPTAGAPPSKFFTAQGGCKHRGSQTVVGMALDRPLSYDEAVKLCGGQKEGGWDDWRLPLESELRTFASDQVSIFVRFSTDREFWTLRQWPSPLAFAVNLSTGKVSEPEKTQQKSVVCVRKDFDVKEGCRKESSRFVSSTGGCRDLATGLTWSKPMSYAGKYDSAHETCMDLIQGDLNAWRLPTYQELYEIKNYRLAASHFNLTNEAQRAQFWTSTPDKQGGSRRYQVNLITGEAYYDSAEWGNGATICVRAGAYYPYVFLFRDYLNGVFPFAPQALTSESLSGYQELPSGETYWFGGFCRYRQSSTGEHPFRTSEGGCKYSPLNLVVGYMAPSKMKFQDAYQYCHDSTEAGWTDWRLPFMHELQALVGPNKAQAYFRFSVLDFIWTTRNQQSDIAQTIELGTGGVTDRKKSEAAATLCVRQGYSGPGCRKESNHFVTSTGGCRHVSTGLTWSEPSKSMVRSLASAEDYCGSLTQGQFNNWRLPTSEEFGKINRFYLAATHFSLDMKSYKSQFYWVSGAARGGQVATENPITALHWMRSAEYDSAHVICVREDEEDPTLLPPQQKKL